MTLFLGRYCSGVDLWSSNVQMLKYSNVGMLGCWDIRMLGRSDVGTFGCWDVRMFGRSDFGVFGPLDVRKRVTKVGAWACT